MTTRIAFAIDEVYERLEDECSAVIAALRARDADGTMVAWDAPAAELAAYDAVMLQTCAGYFGKPDAYRARLAEMEAAGVRLLNSPTTIRWNMDKLYLRELEAKGVTIVPTIWGNPLDLAETLSARGWDKAVVKPSISAGSKNTFVTTPAEAAAHQRLVDEIVTQSTVMVQPFLPEVMSEGEWALLFFNRRFSHAVLKTPKKGDYRVQHELGGSYHQVTPPAEMLVQAERVLAAVDGPLAYTRVDGILHKGQFLLMELEVIEPYLYLDAAPGAFQHYADAILSLAA